MECGNNPNACISHFSLSEVHVALKGDLAKMSRRDHLSERTQPSWMNHTMSPVDPYSHAGQTQSVDLNRSPPQGAQGSHVHRGYYLDPEWNKPRSARREVEDTNNYGRVYHHIQKEETPMYTPGNSEDFVKGYQSRDVRGPVVYGKTKDNMWDRVENLPSAFQDKFEQQNQMRAHMKEEREWRARRAHQEEIEAKKAYNATFLDDPHRSSGFRKQHCKRVMMANTQAAFEASLPQANIAGVEVSGYQYKNRKSDKILARQNQESYLEDRRKIAQMKRTLDDQLVENGKVREQEKIREIQEIKNDRGFVHRLGNNEGTSETAHPDYRLKRSERRRPPDRELATVLQEQVREQTARQNQDLNDRMSSDAHYNPWSDQNANGRGGGRNYLAANGRDPTPVEGASLVNVPTFGTRGGGAPSYVERSGRRVLDASRLIHASEKAAQATARADGSSPWGKAGGGAPVYKADGSINTLIKGTAQRQITEENNQRDDKPQAGAQFFGKRGQLTEDYTPLLSKDDTSLRKQIEERRLRQQRARQTQLEEEGAYLIAPDFVERNRQVERERMQRARVQRDFELHTEEQVSRNHIPKDTQSRQKLAIDLEQKIQEQTECKERNRLQRLEHERHHLAAAEKLFAPQAGHDGSARRPYNPLDYEYKVTAGKASTLI